MPPIQSKPSIGQPILSAYLSVYLAENQKYFSSVGTKKWYLVGKGKKGKFAQVFEKCDNYKCLFMTCSQWIIVTLSSLDRLPANGHFLHERMCFHPRPVLPENFSKVLFRNCITFVNTLPRSIVSLGSTPSTLAHVNHV